MVAAEVGGGFVRGAGGGEDDVGIGREVGGGRAGRIGGPVVGGGPRLAFGAEPVEGGGGRGKAEGYDRADLVSSNAVGRILEGGTSDAVAENVDVQVGGLADCVEVTDHHRG